MSDNETGVLRTYWMFFKKGKNELNFILNVYQTLILIFSISFIGELPLNTIALVTVAFGLFFLALAVYVGRYSAHKVDPQAIYMSPYHQDITLTWIALANGLEAMMKGDDLQASGCFREARAIQARWVREDGKRL